MRSRAAGITGAVALLGLAAAGLAVSGATRAPDASFVVAADRPVPDVTGWELVDARHIAEQDGRPLEEVLDQVAGQNEFAVLATAIKARFPGHFSAARWDPTPTSRGEIAFTEMPTDAALDLIRDSGLGVTVRVVGGTAEQDAVAAQVRASGAVHALTGVQSSSSSVNPATKTVDIQVRPDPTLSTAQVDQLIHDVVHVAEAAAGPRMDVVVSHEPLGSGG